MYSQYFYGSATGLVFPRPCVLTGVLIETPSNTDFITVYDGQNDTVGHPVGKFGSPTNTPYLHTIAHPVYIAGGLYVVVSGSPTSWSIFYTILDTDPPAIEQNVEIKVYP